MNKINYILIGVIIVLALLYFNKSETVKTVTKTETKYDTITKIIDNTKPTRIDRVTIRVTDTIKVVENDTVQVDRVVYRDKEVNKYTYVDTLKNGRLEATILADNIYKRDIKLTTLNKETTTTTTNTILKSNLFIGAEFDFLKGKNNTLQSQKIKLYWQHKDKWLLSGGVGYDNINSGVVYSIGVAFKF